MSTTPINLNKVRKARTRAEKKARADENSVKFGRSKAQKSLNRARAEKEARDHADRKRDR
ncbi:DUF4169 family protein [Roseovarius sp. SCSIO 43702]|uniref:DUF4169 family protein n=1 Tax=Roseovarius sp. SCSIO 43702 TaxID=2823043 RepID=UPI001C731CD4|nr:DUF4169 family protein [Roseovarius sp. SCSIO 43702]QYX55729.1 DUF4169 family protein [Roseovarius sp. SCSIO 43702]